MRSKDLKLWIKTSCCPKTLYTYRQSRYYRSVHRRFFRKYKNVTNKMILKFHLRHQTFVWNMYYFFLSQKFDLCLAQRLPKSSVRASVETSQYWLLITPHHKSLCMWLSSSTQQHEITMTGRCKKNILWIVNKHNTVSMFAAS